jgi:DNA-binding transcriptional LysR family regulator
MPETDPGWDHYRTLLAVLRERSLSGAARTLGLTQPTIGRHIDALEQALGVVLFTRSGHGLQPTEAAEELRPHAEALEAAAAALLRTASGPRDTVAGTARITASEVIGAEVLPPILAELQVAHPALEVELVLSNSLDDLLRRDADIAVRMVRPTQEALVARHVGDIALGLHGHSSYLARAGIPATTENLAGHTIIGPDRGTVFLRHLRASNAALAHARLTFRCDSDLAQLAAIRTGVGLGVCQVPIARRDPDLVRVLAADFEVRLPIWLAMHEGLRGSRRCRATFDALAAGLTRYAGPHG